MAALVEALGPISKPLGVMPNAGYPTVLENRTFYQSDPDYFALQLSELAAHGAVLLGGCCGTTPAHMAAAAKALETTQVRRVSLPQEKAPQEAPTPAENRFYAALCDPKQKPIAVELDPPEVADVRKFMQGARELQENGAAIITIADCPIARARMDSSILACKLRRELHMEALPHMTCRDRNLNATKALLLGLCAEDVHNVLVVTGDPIPSADRDEVKSVYNFNSRMLARYITALGESSLPTPFRVFGALNLNAVNFRVQLDLAKKKQENGVCGFLTQPVLTQQALDNLALAREQLDGKILGGIIPVVSHRNALFMNSEVSGITVDEKIISMYEGLDRAAGEDLAVKVSTAVAKAISPYVDGYYLMTPFGRTGLMARIMGEIRKLEIPKA
jgi:homocysteine S-methyltransferase